MAITKMNSFIPSALEQIQPKNVVFVKIYMNCMNNFMHFEKKLYFRHLNGIFKLFR